MELPICIGTYSNESDVQDVSFLMKFQKVIQDVPYETSIEFRPFMIGRCFTCFNARPPGIPLNVCSGCQLVSFCGKDCQTAAGKIHKPLCKEFPVVNGKNSLHTTGSWEKHIASLRERAARIPGDLPIFLCPRVCNTCKEARHELLTYCKCASVAYCSERCTKADKKHHEDCLQFGIMAPLHTLHYYFQDLIPSLKVRDTSVCEKFTTVSSWNDINPKKYNQALQIMGKHNTEPDIYGWTFGISKIKKVMPGDCQVVLDIERLSYPMSLLYALQSLPGRCLGSKHLPLEDITTLNIHVVNSSPLLDSEPWEVLMHRLPKLVKLNVVFIMQGKGFKPSFYNNNSMLSLLRCNNCKEKNRIITYSVHQMLYHMFFSSEEYTDPDVVVVYGNTHEMPSNREDDIHNDMSFRNMTHNKDNVLVLMGTMKDLVKKGVHSVNAVRPVDQLVPPRVNNLRGFSFNRAEKECNTSLINEKYYFTCLRRK